MIFLFGFGVLFGGFVCDLSSGIVWFVFVALLCLRGIGGSCVCVIYCVLLSCACAGGLFVLCVCVCLCVCAV